MNSGKVGFYSYLLKQSLVLLSAEATLNPDDSYTPYPHVFFYCLGYNRFDYPVPNSIPIHREAPCNLRYLYHRVTNLSL